MVQSNLRIPKRNPKILRRPRLLDQLHGSAHRKLSFVCAPAGYGKTTLLIDFAEDVDGDIFWYRITEQDLSLPAFFENLVSSFQSKLPGFGENLHGIIQSGSQSPRFLAMEFINAVYESVSEYAFLFLDDYHIVSDLPEVVEFLDHVLEFLPDQLRMVIGSRSVYGIPTAFLYIQEQLSVIGTGELAFRPEELKDLCSQYYQINLTDEQTRQIIAESEGWIVAILLALRSKSSTIEIPKILGAREHIYQYLANEVVSALPDYLKEFMYATSIVEEFSASSADYLLEIDNSDEMIKELGELNLFLSDTESGGEEIYRYHQLFAEFLREHLGEELQDRKQQLHKRAGMWFEKNDQSEQAVNHYLQADQIASAAKVIESHVYRYYVAGQIGILKSWYQAVSERSEMLAQTPILQLFLAKEEITQGEYVKGGQLLDLAEAELVKRGDYDNYANLLVTRGMLYRFTGNYQEALETAVQAQKMVREHQLNMLVWDQAERLKGIVSYYLDNSEDAFKYLENAASAFRKAIEVNPNQYQIHDLMMTLADIGYFGIDKGRIFETQKSFREAVELSKKLRGNYTLVAIAYNNYGYLNFLLGDYVEAWRIYAQGLETAKTFQLDRYMIHIMNGQGDVLRDIEEIEEARKVYQEAAEFAEKNNEPLALIDSFSGLVEVETKAGFFNKALYYIREIARVKQEDVSEPEYQARFGRVYLAMGQLEMAEEALESAISSWGSSPKIQQEVVDAYFYYAAVLSRQGKEDQSVEYLKRTFEMAAALGYDQFLVVSARSVDGFLNQAAAHWQSPQLQSMLKRVDQPPIDKDQLGKPPEEKESIETALQVIGFGRDLVRVDGVAIQNTKWHSVGARAMFFFILDRKEVSKEEVALEFWPDFSPGKVNSNFHATLWRVRNALGGKHMIEFKGNTYRINPSVSLHYDVDQFISLTERLKQQMSETEERTLLRQIIELYQDDFLTKIDMAWADQQRNKLRNVFLQTSSRLVEIEIDRKNFSEAIELIERLISLDPYQDGYHLQKMISLVGMGNQVGARKHFHDYSAELKQEIGVEPDQEISEYFKTL
jgi:ATP/maltotriose-dependent transcriptional regulator MalT/two-component SAPR family response regulator